MVTRLTALCLVFVAASAGLAQKPTPEKMPGDEMIERYLAKETERLSQRVFDHAKTRAEWEQKLPRLRQEYFEMLGLWPLPEQTPLHPTVTGTVARDAESVVIEKLHFQSKPGLYVTGNLYRPKTIPGKLPAVLYVCGHSGRGRDGNKTAFQDHGMWFATNGYICLVIDTLQLGEVPGIHHGTYREGRWWWQARGYTPAGVECWNGIRAIDYLTSRPDVDAEKIAVTGISGGGAATFWIAAADERVKCAVPVSGMSDLESYVTNKVINGHCDCMFLINTYQWEWTTIACLIAPRPMLFANSDKDPIFPMDGNRRIIARLRQLYKMYDKPDLVDEHVSIGGHDYRPDLRIAIFQWINKHIKGDTAPVKDADFKPLPGKELRVFPEDKDLPKDSLNGKIDETFVPQSVVKLPEEGKFEEWKADLMKQLREKSFRGFEGREPRTTFLSTDKVHEGIPILFRLQTEPSGVLVEQARAKTPQSTGLTTRNSLGTIFVSTSAKYNEPFTNSIKPIDWYLAVRGGGSFNWTQKSPPNYVARSHALLGRTIDDGRVWDIMASAHGPRLGARQNPGNGTRRIMGAGQAGILGAYAALFDSSIKEIVIFDPPMSHRDGPIFLNVLRVLDIPEALGMLAPRPLTLVNAKDKAFDRTAEIYRRAGAADKFQRK